MANKLGIDSLYLAGRWMMKYSDADSMPAYTVTDPNRKVYTFAFPGQTSVFIRNEQKKADPSILRLPSVFFSGNNNWNDTSQIRKDVDEMIAALGHTNFIVIGLLVGDQPDQYIGTYHWQMVNEYNDRQAARFPGHFLYPAELLPYSNSAKDQLDKVHGVPPTSLRVPGDWLHLNFQGSKKIGEGAAEMLTPCTKFYVPAN